MADLKTRLWETEEWNTLSREDKIDYLFNRGQLDQFNFSLEEGKEFNRRHAGDSSYGCVLCGNKLGTNTISLDDGNIRVLIALSRLTKRALTTFKVKLTSKNIDYLPSFHYSEIIDEIHVMLGETKKPKNERTNPTSYSMLKHWKLIEKEVKGRKSCIDNNNKVSGYWNLSSKGVKFLQDKIALPEELTIYKDEVIKRSSKLKFLSECTVVPYGERQKFRTTNYN